MTHRGHAPRKLFPLGGIGTLFVALVLLGASRGEALESSDLGPPVLLRHAEGAHLPPWMAAIPEGLERAFRTPEGVLTSRTERGEILAETQTLEMEWHLVRNCRESFDASVSLLRRYFLAPSGLLAWRLSSDARGTASGEAIVPAADASAGASASVDDLRACRVLLEAEARWQDPRYGALADHLLEALYAHCVQEDLLLEGASWQRSPFFGFLRIHRSATPVLLSYVDLPALALAAERQKIWRRVFSAMLGLSAAGALARDVPAGAFDPGTERYDPAPINGINALLHLRTLAEVGLIPRQGVEALRRDFRTRGTLLDPQGNENVALYALAAEIFFFSGYVPDARSALDRIGAFRLRSAEHRGLVGYVPDQNRESAWVFDNLLALIAGARVGTAPEPTGAPIPTKFP